MASSHHFQSLNNSLSPRAQIAVLYHDIFHYPLSSYELKRWQAGKKLTLNANTSCIKEQSGFFFVEGNNDIKQRQQKENSSLKKWQIAKKATKIFDKIPFIQLVAVTGSLAMNNASKASDIDLLIVTQAKRLWLTRIITMGLLSILGFKVRKPNIKDEKDRLCLNMWLSDQDLEIYNRNAFTAHELLQIVPLVNKDKTYERLLLGNSWIFDYWPNAVQIEKKLVKRNKTTKGWLLFTIIDRFAFSFQYHYMQGKITNETISLTRAFFHPRAWSPKVIEELAKRGVLQK